ncbi:MAG: 50S ribosomal protein L21 [Candidatus Limnocylindrales bacterium]
MYAVIETGGKQYRVELGSEIEVDRLEAEPGQSIDIARVLLVADGDQAAIGQPVVEGATVSASVVRQMRGDKIVVFKYKPKARTRVKNGHRAELTVLRIADIAWAGRSAAKEQAKADAEQKKSDATAQQAAAKQAAADQALAEKLAASKAAVVEEASETTAKPARRSRAKAAVAADEAPAADEGTTEPADAATADEGTTEPSDAETDAQPADESGKDE